MGLRARRRRPLGTRGLGLRFGGSSGGGFVPAFSPRALAPFSWYDAQNAAAATQIPDRSPNGRSALANGAAAAAATWLPYTVPSVHLEAATAGTNSVSCTAPANTASYSATPRSGGGATTGAAAAGAFSFTTAGDWQSISLLNAGAVELARFDASRSGQTGHTDSYGVGWTVNRGTAGPKTVVQSSAAGSAENLFLFGGAQYMTLPADAIPPMTVGATWTLMIVCRRWADAAFYPYAIAMGENTANSTAGAGILNAETGGNWWGVVCDGTNVATHLSTIAFTAGRKEVVSQEVTPASFWLRVSGSVIGPDSRSAVGNMTPSAASRVGAVSDGGYNAMEFRAALTFDRALTATELSKLVTYYQGGV